MSFFTINPMNHPRGRCAARPCYSHGMFCRWTACTCGSSEMIHGYLRWSPGWTVSQVKNLLMPCDFLLMYQILWGHLLFTCGGQRQRAFIDSYIYISFTFCCLTEWTWNGVNILSFSRSIFLSFCSGWPDLDQRDECPRSRGIGSYVMQPNVT